MFIVYAVMYDTGYDGQDDIVKMFQTEEDAEEYIKELSYGEDCGSSGYYVSEYEVY